MSSRSHQRSVTVPFPVSAPGVVPAAPSAEDALEQVFATAPHGIGLLDARGRWLRVNPALAGLLGRPVEALAGMPFTDTLALADATSAHDAIGRAQYGTGEFTEVRWRNADGHEVWTLTSFSTASPAGGPQGSDADLAVVAHVVDITAQKDLQLELRRLAEHDDLTGLWNRRRFRQELETITAHCARTGEQAALLLLDFDGFKYINDTFGHHAGDDLMVQVVERIESELRPGDAFGRLGGDEFAILLRSITAAQAGALAQAICDTVAGTGIDVAGVPLTTTVSIGFRPLDGAGDSAARALVDADIAMSDAKERGAGCVVGHIDARAHHERITTGLLWSQRIRRALRTGKGFELYAQPIVDLTTGAPLEHELLLRMRDDDGTIVPPSMFLGVADQFRLMRDIDEWVVGEATKLAARYPKSVLGVNLSASSLTDPNLAERIEHAIAENRCRANQLVFEITETEAIDSIEKAGRLARRLSRLGCRLALDDFGSGFASFYHLKSLPLEFIKLDGEFVRDLQHSREDHFVVRAVQGVAAGMHRTMIAEQIEDQATADLLRGLGVKYGQGYHFGRPAPADEVLRAAQAL